MYHTRLFRGSEIEDESIAKWLNTFDNQVSIVDSYMNISDDGGQAFFVIVREL